MRSNSVQVLQPLAGRWLNRNRRLGPAHRKSDELHCDVMNDKAEPRLPGEHEAMFGFPLHLEQRLASEEKVRV
jgi:hypothetical protein